MIYMIIKYNDSLKTIKYYLAVEVLALMDELLILFRSSLSG